MLGDETEDAEMDIEPFWGRVGDNLAIGKMRLLFVADEIPLHLQRIVEFLEQVYDPNRSARGGDQAV